MTALEISDLRMVTGCPADDAAPVEQYRDTHELNVDLGALAGSTCYLKVLKEPSWGFRFTQWTSFNHFVESFGELLETGELSEWMDVIGIPESYVFDVDYRKLPLDCNYIGLFRFWMQGDHVDDFDAYMKELKGQVEAHAPGAKAGYAKSIDPTGEKNIFLFMCGWETLEQHTDFFKSDYPTVTAQRFACVDRIEEYQTQKIFPLGDEDQDQDQAQTDDE